MLISYGVRLIEHREYIMRLVAVAVFALLASPVLGADGAAQPRKTPLNPDVPSCRLVTAQEIEKSIGSPAVIKETSGDEKTAGICSWKGGKPDAYASVTLFPGNGRDVPAGQERPAFDASIELMKRQHKPGELEPISGIGESAWALNLTDNPTRYFAVYLFKNGTNATITTNGADLQATIDLSRAAASRM
jgi:hypothetical protein